MLYSRLICFSLFYCLSVTVLADITPEIPFFNGQNNFLNVNSSTNQTYTEKIISRSLEKDIPIPFKHIISDIRNKKFPLADEKLIQLSETGALEKIVHEVYAQSVDNINLILNFSASFSDDNRCFVVLQSLNNEISSNNNKKVLGLIRLANILENENFNCNSSDTTFRSNLLQQIEVDSVNLLLESMKKGDFATNETIKAVLDSIYDFSPQGFDVVMELFLYEAFMLFNDDYRMIANNIFIRFNSAQAISGIEKIFSKLRQVDIFYDNAFTIDVAFKLNQIKKREDAINFSNDTKIKFDEIVQRIPDCVRNLFFEEQVCLWNPAKKVYLTAIEDKFNYDVKHRRVMGSADKTRGSQWIAVKDNDDVWFRSKEYPEEFMFFANIKNNHENRNQFNLNVGTTSKDNRSAVKIQSSTLENCYLKGILKENEYHLFASDVRFEENNNYSYAFPKIFNSDAAFYWQIIGC